MKNQDTLARNKAAVRKFLEAMPTRDLKAVGECLAEDVVQHYQRPGGRNDAGDSSSGFLKGRDAILDEIGTYYYQLYKPGTITVTIESVIAEDDQVAARFILAATTTRKGEPYENFYNFHYRCKDGLIVEYWEYVDSQYATEMLYA